MQNNRPVLVQSHQHVMAQSQQPWLLVRQRQQEKTRQASSLTGHHPQRCDQMKSKVGT
jgi:hypothetical protein